MNLSPKVIKECLNLKSFLNSSKTYFFGYWIFLTIKKYANKTTYSSASIFPLFSNASKDFTIVSSSSAPKQKNTLKSIFNFFSVLRFLASGHFFSKKHHHLGKVDRAWSFTHHTRCLSIRDGPENQVFFNSLYTFL